MITASMCTYSWPFFSGVPHVIPPSHAYPLRYNVSYPAGSYYQTECHLTVPPYNLPPVFVRPAQPFFQYESAFPMGIGTQPLQNAALLSIRSQSLVRQGIGNQQEDIMNGLINCFAGNSFNSSASTTNVSIQPLENTDDSLVATDQSTATTGN